MEFFLRTEEASIVSQKTYKTVRSVKHGILREEVLLNIEQTRELNYLGYLINKQGINVSPEKISFIENYYVLTSVKEVRRLVDMIT